MTDVTIQLDALLHNSLYYILDDVEDVFNVDWDTYYATVFPIKEKIKFAMAEFITNLPYQPDSM